MSINKTNARSYGYGNSEYESAIEDKRSDSSVIKIEALDTSFFEDISISEQSTIRGGRRPVCCFRPPYCPPGSISKR